MIKNFTLLLFLVASFTLNAQNINIPDVNFKKALVENTEINTNGDGEISENEAILVAHLFLNSKNISDLTGIQHFPHLISLNIYNNELTSLDLNQNIEITYLNCSENKLSSLDLSKNTAITHLTCSYNLLSSLDLSENTAITQLNCFNNQLRSLDLSKNTVITELSCQHNQFNSLDITKNTAITQLYCQYNQLSSLDLTKNTAIIELDCDNNQLSSLDLRKNKAITTLYCRNNQLRSLDLTNNIAIKGLYCDNNHLSSLDLSKNKGIIELYCDDNKFLFSELQKIKNHFSKLNYTSSKKLFSPIENTDGFEIDYSSEALINGVETVITWYNHNDNIVDETVVNKIGNGIYKLLKQGIYYCKMTNGIFPAIIHTCESVTINNNKIIEIPDANFKKALVDNRFINTNRDSDISEYEALFITNLNLDSRNISDLTGIQYFSNLKSLSVYDNQLGSLDLSKNTAITYLFCRENQLTSLDLSKNTEITNINCEYNQLRSLNLSKNAEIKQLNCNNNQLSSLDLSKNTAITGLYCQNNELISLDLSKNTEITQLNCDYNKFLFSELLKIKNHFTELSYQSSKKVFPLIKNTDSFEIDYSSEALIDGKETVFTWYDYKHNIIDETVVSKIDDGIYKFLKQGLYYCRMANGILPATLLTCESIEITNNKIIEIPDANLKKALVDDTSININRDSDISEYEALFITDLYLDSKNISDLTGIQYFSNLKSLSVYNNQLISLDLSKNIAITNLSCGNNQLSNLDLSNNTAIIELYCSHNQLSSLDLSKNTKVKYIHCYNNQLSSLDLSKNTAITGLNCQNNQLNSLDLSNSTVIIELSCQDNQLSSLDLTKNTKITTLYCYNNQLSSLDLSKNTEIKRLHCQNNQLNSLDLSEGTTITTLYCDDNKFLFSELQKIKNHYTDLIYATSKKLFSPIENTDAFEIDYSSEALIDGKETIFTWYDFNDNLVDETIASKIGNGIYKLLKQGLYYCKLENETFPGTALTCESIAINNNKTIEIPDANFKIALVDNTLINTNGDSEISEYEALLTTKLNVNSKNISDLTGIQYFSNLKSLRVYKNQLTNLDLNKNIEITFLSCSNNQLSSLNISNNKKITVLYCYNNPLSRLDISKNSAITRLYCQNNELGSLDLSKNKAITTLYCDDNQLNSIDLSENTAIAELYCENNQLSSLDLSKNKALKTLECNDNQFPLSEINQIKTHFADLVYTSNKIIFEPLTKFVGNSIDYSKEKIFNATNTSFNWYNSYDVSAVEDTFIKETGTKGVFEFLKEGTYYCKMANASLTSSELKTKIITVGKKVQTVAFINAPTVAKVNDVITLNANSSSTLPISFSTVSGTVELIGDQLTCTTEGTVQIKATQAGNNEFAPSEKTIEIIVEKREQSISFDNAITLVKVNDVLNYKATASSGEAVILSILTGEASLTGNKVTFNKEGTVEIKATQAGNDEFTPSEKTIEIEIVKREQNITFKNAPTAVKMYDILEIKASANSGLELTYEIVSGDASIDGNSITFNEVGPVIIKATQEGNDEYAATEKSIEIQVDIATGIEDVSESKLQIYPNPVVSEMVIKFESNEERTICIFDLQGRLKLQKEAVSSTERLNLSDFKSGMYLMRVQSADESFTYKIIKK